MANLVARVSPSGTFLPTTPPAAPTFAEVAEASTEEGSTDLGGVVLTGLGEATEPDDAMSLEQTETVINQYIVAAEKKYYSGVASTQGANPLSSFAAEQVMDDIFSYGENDESIIIAEGGLYRFTLWGNLIMSGTASAAADVKVYLSIGDNQDAALGATIVSRRPGTGATTSVPISGEWIRELPTGDYVTVVNFSSDGAPVQISGTMFLTIEQLRKLPEEP